MCKTHQREAFLLKGKYGKAEEVAVGAPATAASATSADEQEALLPPPSTAYVVQSLPPTADTVEPSPPEELAVAEAEQPITPEEAKASPPASSIAEADAVPVTNVEAPASPVPPPAAPSPPPLTTSMAETETIDMKELLDANAPYSPPDPNLNPETASPVLNVSDETPAQQPPQATIRLSASTEDDTAL